MAGTRLHYLLILPGLVPVRPIQQRWVISGNWRPKMEMRYMHLKEGASGVPSRVGMAKMGRCGGRGGGGGCPGGSNVRAEATAWKANKP